MYPTVAVVSNSSWYLYKFRSNLILRLQNHGYRVIAVAPKDEFTDKIPCDFYELSVKRGTLNPWEDLKLIYSLVLFLKSRDVSVMLTFTPKPNIYGAVSAGLLGKKVICNISGLGSAIAGGGWLSRFVLALYKISMRWSSFTFFQNPDDYQLFLSRKIVPSDLAAVLPGSGVDLERFRFTPRARAIDGKFRFVMVSRLIYEKGILEYIQATQALIAAHGETIESVLVGPIDEANPSALTRDQLAAYVDSGVIKYAGYKDDIREEIARADCVVLPSFYREGTPRILLESAAMGRPLITTDTPGCKEVVRDGVNGFLCTPRSVDCLLEAMEKIITLTADELAEYGRRSRNLAEVHYSEELVLSGYTEQLALHLRSHY
jgi:glycosyltransferase involved in cell wall biosynthesis